MVLALSHWGKGVLYRVVFRDYTSRILVDSHVLTGYDDQDVPLMYRGLLDVDGIKRIRFSNDQEAHNTLALHGTTVLP